MNQLFKLYLQLGGSIIIGWILAQFIPKTFPTYLGKFLFWIGVPISIIAFLRKSDLSSGNIWIAPVIAWIAILLGLILAWLYIKINPDKFHKKNTTQGSFLLSSIVGNTGYMGYPIVLGLVGEKYFAWALFYDMLGTLFGAYGLGVLLAAKFSNENKNNQDLLLDLIKNPALLSFGIGVFSHNYHLPNILESSLQILAWIILTMSLVLIGMRLSEIKTLSNMRFSVITVIIKMLIVPLIIGLILLGLGIHGATHLVLVLQMGMPPAFATLVIAEAFDLDRDLTVTSLALGSFFLLFTLPLWLLLFPIS